MGRGLAHLPRLTNASAFPNQTCFRCLPFVATRKNFLKVPVVMAGHETHVALHLPNADAAEVEARVIQPNGSSQQANVYHIDEKLYLIEFKPEVKGVHVVSVFHRGEHIAGALVTLFSFNFNQLFVLAFCDF